MSDREYFVYTSVGDHKPQVFLSTSSKSNAISVAKHRVKEGVWDRVFVMEYEYGRALGTVFDTEGEQ